ncbi:MAG: hypothetical protein P857_353 [Candidatus Xenolissoclinum pacificiensis L6]|uniref:Uncharacterized protein n=1 Tax=Candidatus Xenolissoclinum pacificiensis L6 TaxID=1401685 RepID=W2V1W3_9RICK|nr:MAG: hypothetical protein P857_353 [Candidatus Xenolissoclinum pacificiensis L6]
MIEANYFFTQFTNFLDEDPETMKIEYSILDNVTNYFWSFVAKVDPEKCSQDKLNESCAFFPIWLMSDDFF